MKTFITIVTAFLASLTVIAENNDLLGSVAGRLSGMPAFQSKVSYEVLLPTSEYPVVYDLNLNSKTPAVGDSLASANYLIDWSLEKDGNSSSGFSAYFLGHHYRYRDRRLQEYHADVDIMPFMPAGEKSMGVQNQAQFCDLLPQYIGRTFESMLSDTTYKYTVHQDTVISNVRVAAVDGVRSFKGVEALEFIYVFDKDKLYPLKSEFVSNPGQIGEQLITATYSYEGLPEMPVYESEDELIKLYPNVFEKYRESTFRLENLPGRSLPPFTAPTITRERYVHDKDSKFEVPSVVAILDAEVVSTGNAINSLRKAIDVLPMQVDLILAFINNDVSAIENVAGSVRPGEHVLMSARGLARDCGVSSTPVIMLCDRDATVVDLIIGFNNNIGDFVIEKTALMAR